MSLVSIFVAKYQFGPFIFLSQFGPYFEKFDAIKSFSLVNVVVTTLDGVLRVNFWIF